MEKKNENRALDELIRASMELTDLPSQELNDALKASLYKKEALMRRSVPTRSISLWYMPMLLNLVVFSLFAVLALLMIANPYLSKLVAALCVYISFMGIVITAVGVKRTGMKADLMVNIEKRGALL